MQKKGIGEAIKNGPNDVKLKYPGMAWNAIAAMQDQLTCYFATKS